MAAILHLHREDSYTLAPGHSAADVIESEVARRTFWTLQGQEVLHSANDVPASFCLHDITALLPCEESEFAFGEVRNKRRALRGTQPAIEDPTLCNLPSRSIYAGLIQVQNLWGRVARHPHNGEGKPVDKPWRPTSYYSQMCEELNSWGGQLNPRHTWSIWNFRGFKTEGLHLGYLSMVMTYSLCKVVLRRRYLKWIMEFVLPSPDSQNLAHRKYWETMSHELFHEVVTLYEQIDAFMSQRSPDEGFPTEIVFFVYICGSLSCYLSKWPRLCPQLGGHADTMLNRSLEVLKQLHYDWPMAERWRVALQNMTSSPSNRFPLSPEARTTWEQTQLVNPASPLDGGGSREPSDQDAPDLAAPIAPPTSTSTINQQQTTESGQIQDPPQLGYGHLPTTNTSFYQCDDFDPDLWMVFADEDSHFNVMEAYPAYDF
ncbi:hypothetical protein LTR99_003705 [Exophiala xenobiotica]|uniref:Transcription factor domain-containing protein n=1 Tax=Vermiconidia calcicola TaxID=1690605 RepID=A0AAV9Q1S5_9PEZI|nr:hypothetical protein LTR99_003705 [Exophiala xenobiotica]KAK5435173.1 hypothetical protein LTR34_002676 [Exophiala xenobiotica]KAK5531398.1 hypothetical protein LTR25_008507 [Vermiconidia calcicola]